MILVTGGTGFIGSHTCVELLSQGSEVVIIDNLSNSNASVLDRIAKIAGRRAVFYRGDICDKKFMNKIFSDHQIDSVIHFAGLKAVGESVRKPLEYYEVNVGGTINLAQTMKKFGVRKIVFSSSATVYAETDVMPLTEESPLAPYNPYGATKYFSECILQDAVKSDPSWSAALLRYFNPVGAHPSGLIGETPQGIPNNLMPRICDVALGKTEKITVFGMDYPTPDGTGVRDYLHVVDLAQGHVKALQRMESERGALIYNLGTGTGHSVLEMIAAFEKASGRKIPYEICPRRSGDLAAYYSSPTKAFWALGWKAKRSLEDMCRDSWNYVQKTVKQ